VRLVGAQPVHQATKDKISMFCHVSPEQVFGIHDVSSVYHVPLLLESQGIIPYLQRRLNLPALKITKEMEERGMSLGQRWKALTQG
jgi:CTP synthase